VRAPRLIALAALAALPGTALAATPGPDRPMGRVFDWSHELNQEELPRWRDSGPLPIPKARWFRVVDDILGTAGRSGLWFSGFSALPFDIALHPREPKQWRNDANFLRQYRRTGLSWDVNVEAWAAKQALCFKPRIPRTCRRTATVMDARSKAPTRRMSLLDPAYRAAALAEIRRIVPRYRNAPYVYSYTGSDEPIISLPRGRRALASPVWRRMAAEVRREQGFAPPLRAARPTTRPEEGLRWLAWSRWAGGAFFDMKAEQAALIRRLDPGARVVPNDYYFIEGFLPWDYTRLGEFADIAEVDPYVSYAERAEPGRGRYNPGFGTKLMSDLTGKPVRVVTQAFTYAGYKPTPADLEVWTAQALRVGGTDISFYALGNPRFTNRRLYDRMLDIATRLRGTRLPAPPVDPATLVVYATASEGQGQPDKRGDARARTRADQLYTTYALLGELARGAFTFDADTRLVREPARLAAARTVWLPRGETLDRPFAEALLAWVRAGGTLISTDADAFTRDARGRPLADVREALIGAPTVGRTADLVLVEKDALGPGLPADLLAVPIDTDRPQAFARVPAGATVIARYPDGAPAAVTRPVGRGRVIAFAADPMDPSALVEPLDLVTLVAALQRATGGTLGHPAWGYRLPGARTPRPPWEGSYAP
jgi:hypothetical protein